MLILKIYFHMNAIIKKIFYKILYGNKIKFGKRVTFRKGFSLVIEKDAKVEIGDDVFFNNYCSINAMESIKIENNCLFGENVKIYDHNHIFKKKNMLIQKQGFKTNQVLIKKNTWVGSNVVILKGVIIGENCVIQANSLVKGNVSDNMIFMQNNEMKKIKFEE